MDIVYIRTLSKKAQIYARMQVMIVMQAQIIPAYQFSALDYTI